MGHSHSRDKWRHKVKEPRYDHLIKRQTSSSKPGNKSVARHQPLCPTPVFSVVPITVNAMSQDTRHSSIKPPTDPTQDVPSTNVENVVAAGSKDLSRSLQMIFDKSFTPPLTEFALPESDVSPVPLNSLTVSLIQHSLVSVNGSIEIEHKLPQYILDDKDEQERLKAMPSDLTRAFIQDDLKKENVVTEIVSLSAVLEQDDFEVLLHAFVTCIDQSPLLKIHLLDGLSQLIRNASQDYIDSDDLVTILKLLHQRLINTHKQSTGHTYRLALTISNVLDSMVDSQVKGQSSEQLSTPLNDYLDELLQKSSDAYLGGLPNPERHPRSKESSYIHLKVFHPDVLYKNRGFLGTRDFLKKIVLIVKNVFGCTNPCWTRATTLVYQAAYASQALMHINDDGSVLKTALQRTGKVIQGISGVVSAIKGFDIIGIIDGLNNIQQGLTGAENFAKLVTSTYTNAKRLMESGQGLFQTLQDCFKQKSAWYPALRVLDRSILECRLADFEELARKSPCKKDPAFQWGLCQRLGEIAANDLWDYKTRKCAIDFLGELYKDDSAWGPHTDIKQWIVCILSQLANLESDGTFSHVQVLLKELETDGSNEKRELYRKCRSDSAVAYPMIFCQSPKQSSLLNHVQNKPDLRSPLLQLKLKQLKDKHDDVYISPKAKSSPRAIGTFDLMSKVQEFLQSKKTMFLLQGDSGAGKSTFNRALEIDLLDFTDIQIKELKEHHEFILICDGYDESQQTKNLYQSNLLNQHGEWRVQMIISCRTEYNGVDYKHLYQPTERNNGGDDELFEEAIITPFDKIQIQEYIERYLELKKQQDTSSKDSYWEIDEYQKALKQIPNLHDLVKNPFLLKLAMEALPQLLDKNSEFSAANVTRISLYDRFVRQWIERNKTRLGEMELNTQDRELFKTLYESRFDACAIAYMKEFVTAIYDHQEGKPVVNYLEYRNREPWKKSLFNKEDGKSLLREAIPLIRNGGQHRFIHKSVLEYGISLAVFDPNENYTDMPQIPSKSRRGGTGSVTSLDEVLLEDHSSIPNEQSLLDTPLGRINFSKTDENAKIAAANAITILIRAGVSFIGADLQGIKIPGADLSYGVFGLACLEGADLRDANLRNIWLRQANLRGAQMTGVQFGELPYLQQDSKVKCYVFSPDGKILAVGTWNGEIHLYETSGWERIRSLKGHSDGASDVAFSAASDRIASVSFDNTVRLWDVDTGNCIQTIQGHRGWVASVAYSPKGDQIASGSDDSTGRLWDVDTGNCIQILKVHNGWAFNWVLSVVYSPKGNQIASGNLDKTVRLWDVDTVDCIQTLQGHSNYVGSVVYSPKGDQIASGSEDKTVRVWDVDTGNCIQILQGHTGDVLNVAYSPGGDQIASGSDDGAVKLWSVDSGVWTLECGLWIVSFYYSRLQWGGVRSIACRNGIDGYYLVTGSDDKSVRRWHVKEGDGEHRVYLCWSSSHEVLAVNGVSLDGVRGLSRLNWELLHQRGALAPTSLRSQS
ncbi:hypothetical protein BGZ80_011092 [Entomortierella chlamydospora]|uniref:Arm-like repeat domain-containing protein n=1 Tax=Entomortierella chlamydospora TaxID=101097 RepID=A0A9P6N2H8_9FUNG|nr:hypothetical protein BGZ80_011092 [Entomortierella chlamydospora]